MKEMLKSKSVIMFIVMVLGITFLSTSHEVKLEQENNMSEQYISMNIQ